MTVQTTALKTLSVTGKLESGLKTSVNVRDLPTYIVDEPERLGGSNAGPNPLEYYLGALSGCTSIVLSYVAKEFDFSYQGFEFSTEGTIDTRGFRGVEGVRTYFQTVKLHVVIETEESDEALASVKAEVERRCPLYNLLKAADVEVISDWSKK